MPITLKNTTPQGEPLEATFHYEKGMNLISFKRNNLEIIDQTKPMNERSGGVIGPHFRQRKVIPKIKDEKLFPHIATMKNQGKDPFFNGISSYASWKAESKEHWLSATLSGKDQWNGIPLSELEGQNFKMTFVAELLKDGLHLELSIISDTNSLVGIQYNYHLPDRKRVVISEVKDTIIEGDERKPIPSTWNLNEQHQLTYLLEQEVDVTFFPFPDPLESTILLDAGIYRLRTQYRCISQENSWQLHYHAGAPFVNIEPLSAQDPKHPVLTVSSLNIHLQILD